MKYILLVLLVLVLFSGCEFPPTVHDTHTISFSSTSEIHLIFMDKDYGFVGTSYQLSIGGKSPCYINMTIQAWSIDNINIVIQRNGIELVSLNGNFIDTSINTADYY
jgi:hypothetical protein